MADHAGESNGVGDDMSEDNDGAGADQSADESEQEHTGGYAEQLADFLTALILCRLGEVSDRKGHGAPVADVGVEADDEESDELRGGCEGHLGVDHRSPAARGGTRPDEHDDQPDNEHGCAEMFHLLYRTKAVDKYIEVQQKEHYKANPFAQGPVAPRGDEDGQRNVQRVAADPELDAAPAGSHDAAENRSDACAVEAERGAPINGGRNTILRTGMAVEHDGECNDYIRKQNGNHGPLEVHAALNKSRSEHVSGDTDIHADPESEEAVNVPVALFRFGRQHIMRHIVAA